MSSDSHSNAAGEDVIVATGVAKAYTLYQRPSQRLMHLLMPWRIYPKFDALKGVSFRVKRSETVGIVGQNGAGKSTLLQIVTGTIMPTAGNVAVSGRVAALLELGAGFEPDFTGRENIYLNGTILGLTRRELNERMNDIIAFSELEEFIDRPVKTYSSGMFMRLAFSVAAHVDADVLIIDEALSVGDARFTQKCMRYLSDFKRRGSILFVSHDLAAVTGLCDRAIWLDHGSIRGEGAAARVCEQYIETMFGDAPATVRAAHAPTPATPRGPDYAFGESVTVFGGGTAPPIAPPGTTTCSPFNPAANAFGSGGGKIMDAGVWDAATGERLTQVTEGQEIDLRIVAQADVLVPRPIFGFYIKDRLGQNLMGDNTFASAGPQPPIPAGTRMAGRFRFRWPGLTAGTYALTVSLADGTADGTGDGHIQRHWMHDAVIFEVLSSSVRFSMVSLQISHVSMDRVAG